MPAYGVALPIRAVYLGTARVGAAYYKVTRHWRSWKEGATWDTAFYAQASDLRLGRLCGSGRRVDRPRPAQGTTEAGPVPINTGEDTLQARVMVGFDVVR